MLWFHFLVYPSLEALEPVASFRFAWHLYWTCLMEWIISNTLPSRSSGRIWNLCSYFINRYHATGYFLYPLKTEKQVSTGYRKRQVAWNGLIMNIHIPSFLLLSGIGLMHQTSQFAAKHSNRAAQSFSVANNKIFMQNIVNCAHVKKLLLHLTYVFYVKKWYLSSKHFSNSYLKKLHKLPKLKLSWATCKYESMVFLLYTLQWIHFRP